ncbi:endolytic transglycosylase MltG [Cyclobacterium amurskyense]|uniref:endolytic transglycosylase MltG n=1 Tax=Cyclobacterium amurskyense TaxID=320787 RepID=UPI0030DD53D3|tara:strand:+ start:29390 stop:30439 length:1050 start_codon:yes stop_codon:yes gene_type:complete
MLTDKKKKYILVGLVAFSVLLTSLSFYFYQAFFSPNILIYSDEPAVLEIPKGSTFSQVRENLLDKDIVNEVVTFSFVAKVMNYSEGGVKPGRYIIEPKLTNRQLVSLLRSGRQTPVNITFNNIRLKDELAEKITSNLEMDKEVFLSLIEDESLIEKYGFDKQTIMAMFLPNTYEVYWNVSPQELFERMYKEYKRYWTDERLAKAKEINMSPLEVATLASIVQSETNKADERPVVAGVYINRLKRGIPLQADPTLLFALKDFTIKRVLNIHKEVESPYNTYKYAGLPPGPIVLPEISSLNAVLNYQTHNYLYFCAKEDFSGYHSFATNLRDHMVNARRYQNALNAAKIFK